MSKAKKPLIINIFILTLITVSVWVIYSVYSSISKPVEVEVPAAELESFDATLDAGALSKLQQSIYLSESELEESISEVTPQIEQVELAEEEPEEIEEPEEEIIEEEEGIPANDETQP